MAENLNSDNLERFFKANLERYSPSPSDDFWGRMETVIPPKPAFWRGGRATQAVRWAVLGLLLLVVATVLLLWRNDRKQLNKLSKTIAQQQIQLEKLGELTKQSATATSQQSLNKLPAAIETAPQQTVEPAPQEAKQATVFAEGKSTKTASETPDRFLESTKIIAEKETPKLAKNELQTVENQSVEIPKEAITANKNQAIAADNYNEDLTRSSLSLPSLLGMVESNVASKTVRVPMLKFRPVSTHESYPRYSVESGPTAFMMPISRLFLSDTLYTGQTSLSYNMGILLNYEINSSTAFQSGYQFKNIRSTRLALRYNSFPVSVRKRWAWGKRRYLEAMTGLSLNSLVNARTDTDGQSVKGLNPTWVGVHGGIASTIPISDQLTLVVGPTAGFSLTPMAGSRRTCEIGVGAHLRYNLW
jgi:hypothetical protein